MPARKVELPSDVPEDLADGLAAIRARWRSPTISTRRCSPPPSRRPPVRVLPDLDRTDLELITIDPPGRVILTRRCTSPGTGSGFVVSYAIADVAAFVVPGGPIDLEAHRRGMTLYAPDRRIPLHPPVLSEGAASLLPDQVRPALLWTLTLDAHGPDDRRRGGPGPGPQPGAARPTTRRRPRSTAARRASRWPC